MTYMIETAPPDALAFDRSESDATWERTQDQALRAFRSGDLFAARTGWARALEIARRHFDWGDPRLAASYTNQAFPLMRQQQLHQASRLLDQALRCWEESWRWIPLMRAIPSDNPVEKNWFDRPAQSEFYALVKRGQANTQTLAHERRLSIGGLEDWQAYKPPTMCDVRKLMAAVFLIVSEKPGS